MIGRVLRHALRQSRRPLVVLPIAAGAFHYLVLLSSSSFLSSGEVAEVFSQPPKAIEAFLGGSADLLSPEGWLASAMVHPIVMALLVAAGLSVAAGAVATEIERGTIDLVMARPVGRARYLLGKAGAALVSVSAVEAGGLAGVLLARAFVERIDELSVSKILAGFALSWTLFAALAMVGLLVSAGSSLRARAIGVSVGLVVAWFFANFIALLIDGISGLRYASPFHYFRPAEVASDGVVVTDLAILAGLAVAALTLALWRFRRRDLSR